MKITVALVSLGIVAGAVLFGKRRKPKKKPEYKEHTEVRSETELKNRK